MAIFKRKNGTYQCRVYGPDGRMHTKVCGTKKEAKGYELKWNSKKENGCLLPISLRKITVDEYFQKWAEAVHHQATPGWRHCQQQLYRTYAQPVLGKKQLQSVTPPMVAKVIGRLVEAGKSAQTQLHVYGLLRKMFRDAVDLFQLLTHSPVLRILKPKVPKKEAKYLTVPQVKKLLNYVVDKDYSAAIWVQLYLGLRVSELIALRWSDIDLENGIATICRSYSRKDSWVTQKKIFRDWPKGGKQHRNLLPCELWQFLKELKPRGSSIFVATSPSGKLICYEHYVRRLKQYCRELGLIEVGTHGLRHSASELYLHYGASEDDIRRFLAHKCGDTTQTYLHTRGRNLEKVAEMIQLFPTLSTNRPRGTVSEQKVKNNGH